MKSKISQIKNIARKIAVSALVPMALFAGARTVHAKDETVKLFYTEVTYTKDNNIIKFRSFIHTAPSNTQRTDFMLGRKFDDLTVYGYWKSDDKDRNWMGIRTDYKIKLEDKLTTNLQFRYFTGLNEKAENHFYFIPSINYKLNDRFNPGILGFAKKSEGKDPFFYVGPSLNIKLTDNLSTNLFYGLNALGNKKDFLMWGFKYNF